MEEAEKYLAGRSETVTQKTLDLDRQAIQMHLGIQLEVVKSELESRLSTRSYLLGYPLGEYVSGKTYGDYEKLLYDLTVREDKAKRMIEKAEEQSSELDRWQYTLRVLQKKLYYAENRAEEQKMEHVALRKKYKSLENDLHKARAKMRRLKSSKRNYQKAVEEEWLLE